MKFTLAQILKSGTQALGVSIVRAEAHKAYTLIDASGEVPEDLKLLREEDDLVVEVDGEVVARVQEFYADHAGVMFSTDGGLQEGSTLMGSTTSAAEPGLVWPTSDAADLIGGAGAASESPLTIGVAGLAGAFGVIAQNSSNPTSADPTSLSDSESNNVSVNMVGGPVLPDHSLRVELFKADGVTRIGDGATLDANGSVVLNVSDYRGVVIVHLIDDDDNVPDYKDETTGDKDVNADMWAVGEIVEANSTVILNLNVLTTVAHDIARAETPTGDLSAQLVERVNAAVASAFGLESLHGNLVVPTNSDGYDSTEVSEAELYGQVLAYLSGTDFNNLGDTQATIDSLVNGGVVVDGDTGTLSTEAQNAFDLGKDAVGLPEKYVDSIGFGGADLNLSAQTITGTLSEALAEGETLWGSFDGGDNWVNLSEINGAVAGTAVSWDVFIKGSNTVKFKVKDAEGNAAPTTALDYEFLGSVDGLELSLDSGIDAADWITSDNTVVISGTTNAADGASVVITLDGATIGSATVSGGVWSLDHTTSTLSDGTYALGVVLKDEYDNTIGTLSPTQTLVIDTSGANLADGSADNAINGQSLAITAVTADTGTAADFITTDKSLIVSGTSDAGDGAVVSVKLDGTHIGYATVSSGAWSFDYTETSLEVGDYTLDAVLVDAAGNEGDTSATQINLTIELIVDSTPPNAPALTSVTDNEEGITGLVVDGDLMNDPTPTVRVNLAGTDAVAEDTVQLYNGEAALGAPVALSDTDIANGYVDITTESLSDGAYNFRASVTDVAGNESELSVDGAFDITIETSPPTITVSGVTISDDTGSSDTDFVTAALTQTISATLSEGLPADHKLLGRTASTGTWVDITNMVSGTDVTWTDAELTEGTQEIQFVIQDPAGNNSAISGDDDGVGGKAYTFDPLNAPTNIAVTATGGTTVANALNATNTSLSFSASVLADDATDGRAEFYVDTTLVGTDETISSTDTTVTFATATTSAAELQAAITAGGAVTVKLYDSDGNDITASGPNLLWDIAPPAAPTVNARTTGDTTPVITGTYDDTETDGGLTVTVDGVTYVLGTDSELSVNADTWSLAISTELAADTYTVTAVALDAAGNASEEATGDIVITEPDSSIVVFDLVNGAASSHSKEDPSNPYSYSIFDANVAYTIYIILESESGYFNEGILDPTNTWVGGLNLGVDDKIVLVGSGSPVKGKYDQNVADFSQSASALRYATGVHPEWSSQQGYAASMMSNGRFRRMWGTLEKAAGDRSNADWQVQLWSGGAGWQSNPNADEIALTNIYLTAMPNMILSTQGLI